MFGHDIDACGVAYENYAVGELLGKQMQMEHRSVGIDYEFGRCDNFLFHGFKRFVI